MVIPSLTTKNVTSVNRASRKEQQKTGYHASPSRFLSLVQSEEKSDGGWIRTIYQFILTLLQRSKKCYM